MEVKIKDSNNLNVFLELQKSSSSVHLMLDGIIIAIFQDCGEINLFQKDMLKSFSKITNQD